MTSSALRISVFAIFFLCLSSIGWAQKSAFPFRRHVGAEKDKTYWLTKDEGPWLIMCASFSGENGLHQANDLVHELRSQQNLNAFVYTMKVDLPETINGAGTGRVDIVDEGHFEARSLQFKFANGGAFEEIAVLIGNFSGLDDRNAELTLEKIKTMRPKSLAFNETVPTNQSLGYWRDVYRKVSGDPDAKKKGPMGQAILIPSPLLPEEYFAQKHVDKFILDLNRGTEFSLLDCPKMYSVRVATFRGETTFNLNEIEQLKNDELRLRKLGMSREKSKLAEALDKAHRLTKELRKADIEAYEFHDRFESYVCVGGFDWLKRSGPDGRDVLNQEVIDTINRYKATVEDGTIKNFPGMGQLLRPKSMPALRGTDIVFDIQPVPVQVPVSSVSKR